MAQKGGYSGDTHLGATQGCGSNTGVDSTTAEVLSVAQEAISVNLKGAEANTGIIYYQVDGTAASITNGFPLGAGDVSGWFPVPGNDLANISVLATVDEEDIFFHWLG